VKGDQGEKLQTKVNAIWEQYWDRII